MQFIQRLRMGGLLLFSSDMDFFVLQSLNVLIGPNASGKTNFIEVLELLSATPTDFTAATRDGVGAEEWLWKGNYLPTRPCDHRSRDRSVYDNRPTDTASSKVSSVIYHYRHRVNITDPKSKYGLMHQRRSKLSNNLHAE